MQTVNVGALDMFFRFLLGMGIFVLATLLPGGWRWFALLGFFPLMTSVFRMCPIYRALGICTCHDAPAHVDAGVGVNHRVAH